MHPHIKIGLVYWLVNRERTIYGKPPRQVKIAGFVEKDGVTFAREAGRKGLIYLLDLYETKEDARRKVSEIAFIEHMHRIDLLNRLAENFRLAADF